MKNFNFLKSGRIKEVCFIAFLLIISLFFHFFYKNFADNDSFFYIREAWRLRTEGIFTTDFPWTYFSMIREYGISLWWGFLIILQPFTYFSDLRIGIKMAGVIFTFLGLLIFYLTIRREKVIWPFIWPLFYLFSAPNILYRFLMVRPQIISTALSFLLLSVLARGSIYTVIITSFLITWIHFNFFFVPIVIYAVYFLAKLAVEKKADFWKGAGVIVGVVLGWVARPDFWLAGKLVYIQIVDLFLTKQAKIPLLFGAENEPLLWITLLRNFWPTILIFIFGVFVLAKFYFEKYKKGEIFKAGDGEEIFTLASFILASGFLFLTMFSARRAYDFWVGFSMLFLASISTYLLPKISFKTRELLESVFKYGIIVLFIFSLFYSIYKNDRSMKEEAFRPDRLEEASLWLRENSKEKDIVFNLNWARFSQMFFWNQKNYYIGGLDPIFQYIYNEDLYWKFHYLSTDLVTKKTCGKEECKVEDLEDTYEVLKNDFKAKFVFLEKEQNPAVYWYLEQDERYEKKFENKKEVIFEVK
ncbi:MAG: hypothetical protein PHZ25_00130 [Candidatus Pacebacteria bacterium]|nr:hypothetical protein [Candidatus Paceibacterota bacterium]